MIPGLLHARVPVPDEGEPPPPAPRPLASPAYQSVLAFATGATSSEAVAQFNFAPDGTWSTSGTGYSSESGTWFEEVVAGAGEGFEVRITPTRTDGVSGLVSNDASDWVSASSARALSVQVQRYVQGMTIAYYSVQVEVRPAGGSVVSSASFNLTATAEVREITGGGGCPGIDMWLGAGLRAGDVREGQLIDCVTTVAPEQRSRLRVLANRVSRQPCYRIVTRNGAACVLSSSTPFTLRDGSTRYADQMLGEQVLRDDGAGGLVWDDVVECQPVGERDVVRISVGGHSLLAGESPLMRIVSHNQSKD